MQVKSITLLGHKDHGKSTLIGSLLMQTGSATKVRIKEAEKYSKRLHKAFEPAFILDSFAEERTGEMTIDTTRAEIKYRDLAFALIDVPGHEELIKNMMTGASYGEIALLLVSAKSDEGIRDQTKRHLFLSRMFGIEDLVVAVNKMDLRRYEEKVFMSVKKDLSDFIKGIGFDMKRVHFVPISAYAGENLIKKSVKMGWYKGLPLMEELYTLALPRRGRKSDSLRITMQGVMPGEEDVAVGKIVNGVLSVGERVIMPPMSHEHIVKEIIVKGKSSKKASVGENIALRFKKTLDFDPRGAVMCRVGDPIKARDRIDALVFATKELGSSTRLRFIGREIDCDIVVNASVDVTTGEETVAEKIAPLSAGKVTLELAKPIVSEPFDKLPELGRFVLYDNEGFAGIGIITS